MSKIKDGGPAFPGATVVRNGMHGTKKVNNSGTSLRDYFAIRIAGGLAAFSGTQGTAYGPGEIATRSYEIADAMIAQRDKGGAS
jgi:hypothetical protein